MFQSDFFRALMRSPVTIVALILVIILVTSAVFAPLIAPHTPFDPASLNLMDGFSKPMQPNAFTGNTYLLGCLLYTSPSPRDKRQSRMPSSA